MYHPIFQILNTPQSEPWFDNLSIYFGNPIEASGIEPVTTCLNLASMSLICTLHIPRLLRWLQNIMHHFHWSKSSLLVAKSTTFHGQLTFLLVQIPISHGQIHFMNTRSPFPIVKSLVLIRKSQFFMLNSQFGIIESQFSTVESNFFDDKIPFLMGKSQYWITQSLNIHFLWSNPTFGSLNPHEIHIFPPMLDHSNPHFRSNKSTFCGWSDLPPSPAPSQQGLRCLKPSLTPHCCRAHRSPPKCGRTPGWWG